MSEKIFLKLNLDFIVAEIRGVFGSVGGVCVCVRIEIVAATVFLFCKGPIINDIRAILIPEIYARLQKIASNFSKFSGEAPRFTTCARTFGTRFGALPPYRTSLPKFLDPPLDTIKALV